MSITFHPDPFSAMLTSSVPLAVTSEQRRYIREVLSICSSDTQFADKAYRAISHILVDGSVPIPAVTSLTPSTVVLGTPSFTIHVIGTDFTTTSVILFNGFQEPTTYVSATELTTGVNMAVWLAPATVPIAVITADGVVSNSVMFSFTSI